jgi:hypothetical protein
VKEYLVCMDQVEKELMRRIVIDEIAKDESFLRVERKPMEVYISIAKRLNEPLNNTVINHYRDLLWKRHGIRKIRSQGQRWMRMDITRRPLEWRFVKRAKQDE